MQDIDFGRLTQVTGEIGQHIIRHQYPFTTAILDDGQYRTSYHPGDYFGAKDATYTLTLTFALPPSALASDLALQIDTSPYEMDNSKNPQIKLFINNQMVQALDVNHRFARLEKSWFSEDHQLIVKLDIYSGREEKKYPLRAAIVAFDQPTFAFYFDLKTYLDCWQVLKEDPVADRVYRGSLMAAIQHLDLRTPYSPTYYAGIEQAQTLLRAKLMQQPFDPAQGTVYAVGHTHIDMAWLWTVAQAIEKGERSFTSVLALMRQYPDFKFLHSTPQLYLFIKERYPKLYAQIKAAVAAGQWEPEGAMWVEADCNLTSGESLVRQILYGKRFFQTEFGVDNQILWLPDVFGYSAALPQILRKSGVHYFMTTKLAWNDTDEIPFDSFQWQGIDGSKVLTHLINTVSEGYAPTPWFATYNGMLNARVVKKSWDRYKQRQQSDEILLAYGYGDGGGGPTFGMIETMQRLENHVWGMPLVKSATALDFFQALDRDAERKPLPTWLGELYFEFHRGTYTSIAKNKQNNRRAENTLQTVEKLFSTYAPADYPADTLHRLWQTTLLDQFHDVLPGSAIEAVYQQTDKNYAQLFTALSATEENFAATQLTPAVDRLVLYNPAGLAADLETTIALPPDKTVQAAHGQPVRVQHLAGEQALIQLPQAAPLALQELQIVPGQADSQPRQPEPLDGHYATDDLQITFDAAFNIVGLYDKQAQREVLPAGGQFNRLMVYADYPREYDAWNIDGDYRRQSWPVDHVVTAEVTDRGPIRDTLHIVRQFNQSMIEQWLHLYHGTTRIAFTTRLDWHEHHALLRTLFDVAVNAQHADFDIQFGNVSRPVARNTSWEQAQFEVAGQKWADMSETDYGLSLLTDAKYGYSATYQQLGLTLLKSATEPNPNADQGIQKFTYEALLHQGSWRTAATMAAAQRLNIAPVIWPNYALPDTTPAAQSRLACNQQNVLLDTVKQAEDDDALIVRLYEYHNAQTTATLTCARPVKSAMLCNLLEHDQQPLTVSADGRQITVPFKPYEIQTIKLRF
ncbi:alpha-mannosidase [Schleiferilactobacillus harbinensis]|uniref:alpha-mannosidase n=1 Tax=Schleiferilactobacillus harbinensis TaxID=304207 RepID=UPI001AAE397C|nr:glycoside hydrolase family 38 C-terminal domain-containing protein [Schleiferilactobacillus harbinensis]MBO3091610.1 alpha-mannosidase [Schleiferilactobacillus harbinensis]